jgi:hypothetical protein
MARNRFVRPETVRYDLSDGDWIEIKRELSYGEAQKLAGAATSGLKGFGTDESGEEQELSIGLDLERYELLKFWTWLVDWSFRDEEDKPVPVSMAALRALTEETGEEIAQAIQRHEEALAEEKKAQPGETSPTPK